MSARIPRAIELGVLGCPACSRVVPASVQVCPRCAMPLHARKPGGYHTSWALLIAAAILYIPANLLPIMLTSQLLDVQRSTILSGVFLLWQEGSWDLALIVFTASIVIPLAKIVVLAALLLTCQSRSTWRQRERTQVYRIIEFIGHWSMLDVFVVALLLTLVHFGKLAQVEAGSAIIPFTGVVVLTMLASMSFDPRLIWDAPAPEPASASPDHDRPAATAV
jgi:paraquat-inducible protein A